MLRSLIHAAGRRRLSLVSGVARVCRDRATELLFPPTCVGCQAAIDGTPRESFCVDCLDQLETFQPPYCFACGASVPVPLGVGTTCGHCQQGKPRFDRAVALGPYDGLLRELVLRAKKPHGETAAIALARQLLLERGDELQVLDVDVVCATPMHWRRRAMRLANSTCTMAEVIARTLGKPVAAGLLARRRSTAPQSTLPPSGRAKNVRGAFAFGAGYQLDSAHVLLVDDILTTGATCNEASRTLKKAGASQVSVAVIARSFSGR